MKRALPRLAAAGTAGLVALAFQATGPAAAWSGSEEAYDGHGAAVIEKTKDYERTTTEVTTTTTTTVETEVGSAVMIKGAMVDGVDMDAGDHMADGADMDDGTTDDGTEAADGDAAGCVTAADARFVHDFRAKRGTATVSLVGDQPLCEGEEVGLSIYQFDVPGVGLASPQTLYDSDTATLEEGSVSLAVDLPQSGLCHVKVSVFFGSEIPDTIPAETQYFQNRLLGGNGSPGDRSEGWFGHWRGDAEGCVPGPTGAQGPTGPAGPTGPEEVPPLSDDSCLVPVVVEGPDGQTIQTVLALPVVCLDGELPEIPASLDIPLPGAPSGAAGIPSPPELPAGAESCLIPVSVTTTSDAGVTTTSTVLAVPVSCLDLDFPTLPTASEVVAEAGLESELPELGVPGGTVPEGDSCFIPVVATVSGVTSVYQVPVVCPDVALLGGPGSDVQGGPAEGEGVDIGTAISIEAPTSGETATEGESVTIQSAAPVSTTGEGSDVSTTADSDSGALATTGAPMSDLALLASVLAGVGALLLGAGLVRRKA